MKRMKVMVHLNTGVTLKFTATKVMVLRNIVGKVEAFDFIDSKGGPLYLDPSSVVSVVVH